MKWPTVQRAPGSVPFCSLRVDLTYKKIEAGKTLFSLQFI